MTIGENIHNYRKRLDLSQERLAELANENGSPITLKKQHISQYELDKHEPDLLLIGMLKDILEKARGGPMQPPPNLTLCKKYRQT